MTRVSEIEAAAKDREARHGSKWGRRNLATENPDKIGLMGEAEFSRLSGIALDLERKDGDKGKDFETPLGLIDIKTFTRPHLGLLVEKGKTRADIFICAGYIPALQAAFLDGWCYKGEILEGKTRDFGGHGIVSHHLPPEALHPISVLLDNLRNVKVAQA